MAQQFGFASDGKEMNKVEFGIEIDNGLGKIQFFRLNRVLPGEMQIDVEFKGSPIVLVEFCNGIFVRIGQDGMCHIFSLSPGNFVNVSEK